MTCSTRAWTASPPRRPPNGSPRIESLISGIAKQGKLYGRHFDDLLALKYLHQRYTNYVSWLGFSG